MIMAEYNFVELQSGFYMRKSSQSNEEMIVTVISGTF